MKREIFVVDRIEGEKAVLRSKNGEIIVNADMLSTPKEGKVFEISILEIAKKPPERIKKLIKKALP